MPIESLDSVALQQRCDNCDRTRALQLDDLIIGTQTEPPNPLIIPLPACECGAQEFLFRASVEKPTNTLAYRHALLVAKFYSELVSRGRVHADLNPGHLAPPPADSELRRVFPNGLQLNATSVAEKESKQ